MARTVKRVKLLLMAQFVSFRGTPMRRPCMYVSIGVEGERVARVRIGGRSDRVWEGSLQVP